MQRLSFSAVVLQTLSLVTNKSVIPERPSGLLITVYFLLITPFESWTGKKSVKKVLLATNRWLYSSHMKM